MTPVACRTQCLVKTNFINYRKNQTHVDIFKKKPWLLCKTFCLHCNYIRQQLKMSYLHLLTLDTLNSVGQDFDVTAVVAETRPTLTT